MPRSGPHHTIPIFGGAELTELGFLAKGSASSTTGSLFFLGNNNKGKKDMGTSLLAGHMHTDTHTHTLTHRQTDRHTHTLYLHVLSIIGTKFKKPGTCINTCTLNVGISCNPMLHVHVCAYHTTQCYAHLLARLAGVHPGQGDPTAKGGLH